MLLNSLDFIIPGILKSILIAHVHPKKDNTCKYEAGFDALLLNFGVVKGAL